MTTSKKFNIIDQLLLQHIDREKIALIDTNTTRCVTYRDLSSGVVNFSYRITKAGKLKKGSIVTLLFGDSIESSVCFFSLIYHGLIPCYLSPDLPIANYDFYLKSITTQFVLISSAHIDKFKDYFISNNVEYAVIYPEIIEQCIQNKINNYNSYPSNENSPLFCSYTSGTTGHPSAILHRHKDVKIMNDNYVKQVLNIKTEDVIFSTSKMYFPYGLNNLFISLFNGATSILSPNDLSIPNIWKMIKQYRPSVFLSVPTIYRKLINDSDTPDEIPIPSTCISAGERLPEVIFDAWNNKFGVSILDGIGSTEILSTYISNKPNEVKRGSTGRLVNGFQAMIKDKRGRVLPPYEIGVLWVKGETYPDCYLNNQKATKEHFVEQWFITHDIFYQDDEGYFFYQGRVNDLIYNKGIWIVPSRIENRINEHKNILENVLVGRKTGNGDTLLINFVTLKNNTPLEKLKEDICFLNRKNSHYRDEEDIHLICILNDFPKTETGKIKRHELMNTEILNKEIHFIQNKEFLIVDKRGDEQYVA